LKPIKYNLGNNPARKGHFKVYMQAFARACFPSRAPFLAQLSVKLAKSFSESMLWSVGQSISRLRLLLNPFAISAFSHQKKPRLMTPLRASGDDALQGVIRNSLFCFASRRSTPNFTAIPALKTAAIERSPFSNGKSNSIEKVKSAHRDGNLRS
jgi:hypothetical protein